MAGAGGGAVAVLSLVLLICWLRRRTRRRTPTLAVQSSKVVRSSTLITTQKSSDADPSPATDIHLDFEKDELQPTVSQGPASCIGAVGDGAHVWPALQRARSHARLAQQHAANGVPGSSSSHAVGTEARAKAEAGAEAQGKADGGAEAEAEAVAETEAEATAEGGAEAVDEAGAEAGAVGSGPSLGPLPLQPSLRRMPEVGTAVGLGGGAPQAVRSGSPLATQLTVSDATPLPALPPTSDRAAKRTSSLAVNRQQQLRALMALVHEEECSWDSSDEAEDDSRLRLDT